MKEFIEAQNERLKELWEKMYHDVEQIFFTLEMKMTEYSPDTVIQKIKNLKQQVKEKDERIAELEEENEVLRKTLNNLKGDKASDTLVNAVNAVYEPLLKDNFDDIERLKKELKTLRHEICEKIRERVVNGGFRSTIKEFADGIYEKYKNWVFDILDQIERGEE